jgi:CRISPR-associated protein Cas1
MVTEPIPISLVAHTVFCPRRAWLEACGETVDSLAIEQGLADHKRVDQRADERSSQRRSVDVHDDELGIIGRCDVIDISDEGVELVEFKSAPLRRTAQVTDAQRIQLALQRRCLESHGQVVLGQSVYFTTLRKRVPVELTDTDQANALGYVAQTRSIIDAKIAPPPLVNDPRCRGCSHVGVCLPDEHAAARSRRIIPKNPGGEVVHVTLPGGRVSLSKGRLRISQMGIELRSLPVERVHALTLHGNIDVSSAAMRELMWNGRVVSWCSLRGRLIGYAAPAHGPNGQARVVQHVRSAEGDLPLARELIASKIANQATQLRRNSRGQVASAVKKLRALAATTPAAANLPAILGIEGEAAAIYFREFPSMLRDDVLKWCGGWPGRRARGARDPLNVMLNLSYGLLLSDVVRAVIAAGLDPHAGFVHSSNRNKPALALDLMEQFRPVVAESAVLGALNNGELRPNMVSTVLGDARLRDDGRRVLVAAYERRISTEFTHPVFGYRLTWRRAIEVQARMILGVLDGTQETYAGVRVR